MQFPVRFEPVVDRPPLHWPDGARLAVHVVLNVEYFQPDRPSTSINPAMTALTPDVYNHSWRDYGLRAGIWRLMALLDRLDVPASVALNADVCGEYPRVVEEILARGWEVMGHGTTNSRFLNPMEEDEERATIQEALDVVERATGRRPRGWLGPALAENWRTPALLEEAGLDYVCDWLNDDEPYRFTTPAGRLVSVPYSGELNDIHCFLRGGYTAPDYGTLLTDQFDVLYAEGADRPKVMAVPLHPFITGHPFRAKYLEQAFRHMATHDGVWFCTGSEIADAYDRSVGVPA